MGVLLAACLLVPPVPGPMVRPYAPSNLFAGHWGVDFAGSPFDPVGAPLAGTVVFAGSVAGMNSVSILGNGGLRVSVSYLASVVVESGDRVTAGQVVGLAGYPHGRPGVHLSARIGPRYRDPAPMLVCSRVGQGVLRLVTPIVRAS